MTDKINDTTAYLLAMRTLIAEPQNWTQYSDARDKNLYATNPYGVNAICWCLNGAESFVYTADVPPTTRKDATGFLNDATGFLTKVPMPEYGRWYIKFNDSHSHSDVINLIDAAIELSEARN